jgi:uncharacterized surface protein with fasciclin (FAS1) repeats
MVGGQSMLPSKTILDNAVNSADQITLVAAVSAARLVDALKGAAPLTVFAPGNRAFEDRRGIRHALVSRSPPDHI